MKKINQDHKIFGRTKGRSKKKIDLIYYNKLIDRYRLEKLDTNKSYILDIGSGYGETSIYLSLENPLTYIISCDKYINGNLNLLKKIEKQNIKNIHVHHGSVQEILDKHEVKKYFDSIWIFFPDPWPKKRHNKRRIISLKFLKLIYNYIKQEGKIYIATDSLQYSRDILKVIYESKHMYKWLNQNEVYFDIKDYFNIETKFYKKAIICGRNPSLFILKKI